ncbi:hypothetical protein [Clostridium baratii]|uniref:Filamentous hemagglutinin n=1 Tax=Clostridium baratii TaxID=1561 RepID=A0A174PFL7_9CLOT|nr:hypothetical protein [Clostridium baratii]CUP58371.1 Filamentous hemagglutinin [Clostridium baratii]
MKPDKKYMSLTNDDIIFDTFEVESPFCDLNYGLTPIVNIESNTFRTLEPSDEAEDQDEDLRKSTIDKALGGNEELMCYNKDGYVDTSDNFEIPTPTEVLRGLDLDLNEDDLVRSSLREPQDFDNFEAVDNFEEFDNLEDFDDFERFDNFEGVDNLEEFDDIMYDLNNSRVESTPPRPQPGRPPRPQPGRPPVQPPRPQPGRPPVQPPRPQPGRPPVQPPRPPRPPVQPPRPPRPPVQPPRPPRPPVVPPIIVPRPPRPCTGEFVFEQIRRNNPNILNTLSSFRVPPPIARALIIRIANLTLQYCFNRE